MPTECSSELFEFAPVEGRRVVAGFDGGAITPDAGALLLGQADKAIGLSERLAACFTDRRNHELIEHEVSTLVMQRVFHVHDLAGNHPVDALDCDVVPFAPSRVGLYATWSNITDTDAAAPPQPAEESTASSSASPRR